MNALTDYQVLHISGQRAEDARRIARDAIGGDAIAAAWVGFHRAVLDARNAKLRGVVQ